MADTNTTPDWRWWAIVGFGRTVANPYSVFRYNRASIEQWKGGLGWVEAPSLLRYVHGYDDGADLITENQANKLTGGNARRASGKV